MPRVTKKECWDMLEGKLQSISETRLGQHIGEAKLAVYILVSAGRDEDLEFIEGPLFEFYCRLGALHIKPTKELVLNTLKYLNEGGSAKFRLLSLDD